jgi:HlyD family secretion protein
MATATLPQNRPARRGWLIAGAIVILVAISAAMVLAQPPAANVVSSDSTATVLRGEIIARVDGTGTIAAEQTLDLAFQTSGTIVEVLVKEGDSVTVGQPLARIDDRELRSQVASAEASLASAQAQLAQTQTGNATEQDLAAAQASVANAEANLQQTRTGNTTAADIAEAQASVRSAQAQLDALRAGPNDDELASAQATYDKAVADLEAQRASLSAAKTRAESDVTTAANTLRDRQDEYSKIYWDNRELEGRIGGDLPQENRDDEAAALRAVQSAEESLRQSQVAFDQSKVDEQTGIQKAEATLREAAEKLKATQQGSTSDQYDIIQAQASLDQAKANLQKLREGATAAEIAASQANVDQARANLAQLSEPATASDVEIQQASVAQAEQSLEQARLKLEQAVLTAPFDGLISAVEIVPGSVVSNATVAFSLIDRDPLRVDLTLSENDVAQVALGQVVDLTIDALSDWVAQGTVTYIAPAAETNNDVVTYRVRISLPDTDDRVKVGMTSNLQIVVSQKQGVLLVPNSALLPSGSGRVVQIPATVEGQAPQEIPVEVGLTDGVFTEVISGLNEGQVILIPVQEENLPSGGLFGN